MDGYIKLHRQITENEWYFSERFTRMAAWIDLLLLATHKERTVYIRGNEISLKPGELCYAQTTLAKRWRWNFRTVRKFLNELEKREMIQYRKSSITTVVSIINWDRYQVSTTQSAMQSAMQSANEQECKRMYKNNTCQKKLSNQTEQTAIQVYEYYAEHIRAGARASAIKNIIKLLKAGETEASLKQYIDNYRQNGVANDKQYRIQANNFFGRDARYQDHKASDTAAKKSNLELLT